MNLRLLNEKFTLNKLPQFAELPQIFVKGENCFIARTDTELCILCPDYMAPNNVQQEIGWRGIKVLTDHALTEPGILASVIDPLAAENIPIVTVTTFDSVYVFLMEEKLVEAVRVLQQRGYSFLHEES